MLEGWKNSVNNGKDFGAFLTDLSKAFDCTDHELLIAKLNAYGFSLPALKLTHDYLSNRKQWTKTNSSYSSWHEIIFGVPLSFILGPLLFNISLIASHAYDNKLYVSVNNMDEVIKSLEETSTKLFKWFSDNLMKSNAIY